MSTFFVLLALSIFACVIWALFWAAADKLRREQAMREWWEHPPDQTDEEGDHEDR